VELEQQQPPWRPATIVVHFVRQQVVVHLPLPELRPGFFPRPVSTKHRGPDPVYRTGSTGNHPKPDEFKFQIKILSSVGLVRYIDQYTGPVRPVPGH
jgi:hypothetical protein